MMSSDELTRLVVETLDDNKAGEVAELDVSSLTDLVDGMVICSATSSRHARSLADKVLEAVRKHDIRALSVEGKEEGEWVLIDLHDIVVHILLPEQRKFYDLEKLWSMTESTRESHAD